MNTARTKYGTISPALAVVLFLSFFTVEFAHAAPGEDERPGLRDRLTDVTGKVGDTVGTGLTTVRSQALSVGSKVQGGVSSGLEVARTSIKGAGSRVASGLGAGFRSLKDRVGGVGAKVSSEVGERVRETHGRAELLRARLQKQVLLTGSNLSAQCVTLLTTTGEAIQDTLTHSSDPWDLGPNIAAEIEEIWRSDAEEDAQMRRHVRVIFEARETYAANKINLATLAEREAFQKTIGRFWSPEPVAYADFLNDEIDKHLYPESLHAVALFRLARELGQDFNERFDVIRATLSAVVGKNAWVPLPSHIAVRATSFAAGPVVEHRNEKALIGALWEVAHRLPVDVRERSIVTIEDFIKNQEVPESRRARFRRFVYSGEFERVARLVETLQMSSLIYNKSIGPEQLIVRSNDLDGPRSQQVRDELRSRLKPTHEAHPLLIERIGAKGVETLRRVFGDHPYLELDNGGEPPARPELRDQQFEKIIARYKWSRLKPEDREGIERALAALRNAGLEKEEFIEALSEIHDNTFGRVVLKTFLPDFLTKRAPRDRAQ